jgi:hypothetical protein
MHLHHHHHQHHHDWQNSFFLAIAFLSRLCQICLELDHPVFTSLDFATINVYRARSPALRPTPNLKDQVPVFMSPRGLDLTAKTLYFFVKKNTVSLSSLAMLCNSGNSLDKQ